MNLVTTIVAVLLTASFSNMSLANEHEGKGPAQRAEKLKKKAEHKRKKAEKLEKHAEALEKKAEEISQPAAPAEHK